MNYEEARAIAWARLNSTSAWRAVVPISREVLIALLGDRDDPGVDNVPDSPAE